MNSPEKAPKKNPSVSAENLQSASSKAFRYATHNMDTKMDKMRALKFKPAKVNQSGKTWFVYYSYLNDRGKYQRFRIYRWGSVHLNRIRDLNQRLQMATDMKDALNLMLSEGFNPFEGSQELSVSHKQWTVVQALNYFKQKLSELTLRTKSRQTYMSALINLYELPQLNKPLDELTPQKCYSFITSLASKKKWSNTTYNNNLRFFKMIFTYMKRFGIATTNPFAELKPLPKIINKHLSFSDEVLDKIKQNADQDLWRFIYFLYNTGTRPNEARQLTHDHILRNRKLVFIPASISKSNKDRYVGVSDEFLEMFRGEGLIFGGARDKWGRQFAELKKKLKLDSRHTLYSIKHTKALHLVHDGVKPTAIMQFLGHSTLDMTMKYLRELGGVVDFEAAHAARKI